MRRSFLLVGLAVAVVLSAGTAAAATTDPHFEVYTPEQTLTPGTTTQLTVQVVNDAKDPGDSARTAVGTNATLIANETAISVRSGNQFVGDIPDGSVRTATYTVQVPADIDSGTHTLYLDISYEADGRDETASVEVPVRIDDRPQFSVVSVSSDTQIGDSGPVNVTLRNTGTEDVTDALVTVQSQSGDVTFGTSPTATRYVGGWAAGERRTVSVEASVAGGAQQVAHALTASVSFEDEGGDAGQSRSLAVGVTPAAEQEFTLAAVASSLTVGDRGTVSVEVTNDGPRAVTDATLGLQPGGDIQPIEAERSVGDLGVGESTTVDVPARVAAEVNAGERQPEFVLRYDNPRGDRRASDGLRVTAEVAPEQSFSVGNTTSSLIVGDRGTVEGTITNDGPHAVTDAAVRLTTQAPTVTPVETEDAIGDLEAGESAEFSLPVRIDSAADPGDRQLSFAVQYDNHEGDRRTSDPTATTVPVTAEQSFSVADPESTLLVGDRGTVTATVENEGPETARNAVVRLTTRNENVRPRETEFAVGDLPAGESTEVSFPVAIASSAEAGVRQLSFAVEYENRDGDPRLTEGLSTRVEVAGEQTFSVSEVGSTLRVGDDGTVSATVRNDGPLPVGDAVVKLVGVTANANPTATEFAVGDLPAGEAAEVSFPVEVSESAEAGPRQFSLAVEYRTRQDERRTSEQLSARLEVAPERPQFALDAEGTTLEAGGSETVTVVLTNNGDQTVTDITAKVFVDDPLSTTDDEEFVGELGPGESTELVFGVGASGGALEKSYPLSIDFQYDESDGDTKLSDTYRVPVDVTTPDGGGGLPVAVIVAGVLLLAAAAGVVWWRRQ